MGDDIVPYHWPQNGGEQPAHQYDVLPEPRTSDVEASSLLIPSNVSQEPGEKAKKLYLALGPLWTEWLDLGLLFLLYYCQGVAAGLGSVIPILLKSGGKEVQYGRIGLLSIAFYPYSMKVIWSPIVDGFWAQRLGRRKSWIVPTLALSGCTLLVLALSIPDLFQKLRQRSDLTTWAVLVAILFVLVFLNATQGCAADGWAVTLLPHSKVHFASSAHHMGMVLGEFTSYTLFLFVDEAQKLPPTQQNELNNHSPDIFFSRFVLLCSVFFLVIALPAVLLKSEDQTSTYDRTSRGGIWNMYRVMWRLLSELKPLQSLIIVHLLSSIAFEANDSATNLKLLERGFGETNLALVSVIDLPFDIFWTTVTGILCTYILPMRLWCWAFIARLVAALIAQVTLSVYSGFTNVPIWYLALVILQHILTTSTATIMAVTSLAFHMRVTDPICGSTYMTILATSLNMGRTPPRLIVMNIIDMTTMSICLPIHVPRSPGSNIPEMTKSNTSLYPRGDTYPKSESCRVVVDGYLFTNALCIGIGALLFAVYLRPAVLRLQLLPEDAWRLH